MFSIDHQLSGMKRHYETPLHLPQQLKACIFCLVHEAGSKTQRGKKKSQIVTLQTAYVGIISQPKQFAFSTPHQLISFLSVGDKGRDEGIEGVGVKVQCGERKKKNNANIEKDK